MDLIDDFSKDIILKLFVGEKVAEMLKELSHAVWFVLIAYLLYHLFLHIHKHRSFITNT